MSIEVLKPGKHSGKHILDATTEPRHIPTGQSVAVPEFLALMKLLA